MVSLGRHHYFAIVDDSHDIKSPRTIVRVFDDMGPDGTRELTSDVVWARTTVLDRIRAGEVPYQAKSITEKQALRIRERWEKKIAYRYFVLVWEDDPTEKTVNVIREWDSSVFDTVYEEMYVGHDVQQWLPSNMRWEFENGRDYRLLRPVESDAGTVHQFIEAVKGR